MMLRLSAAAIFILPVLAACNTVDGVGRDVSAVGRGVSHVSQEVSEEVFGADKPVRRTYTTMTGQACDASPPELRGSSGLPACPRSANGSLIVRAPNRY